MPRPSEDYLWAEQADAQDISDPAVERPGGFKFKQDLPNSQYNADRRGVGRWIGWTRRSASIPFASVWEGHQHVNSGDLFTVATNTTQRAPLSEVASIANGILNRALATNGLFLARGDGVGISLGVVRGDALDFWQEVITLTPTIIPSLMEMDASYLFTSAGGNVLEVFDASTLTGNQGRLHTCTLALTSLSGMTSDGTFLYVEGDDGTNDRQQVYAIADILASATPTPTFDATLTASSSLVRYTAGRLVVATNDLLLSFETNGQAEPGAFETVAGHSATSQSITALWCDMHGILYGLSPGTAGQVRTAGHGANTSQGFELALLGAFSSSVQVLDVVGSSSFIWALVQDGATRSLVLLCRKSLTPLRVSSVGATAKAITLQGVEVLVLEDTLLSRRASGMASQSYQRVDAPGRFATPWHGPLLPVEG